MRETPKINISIESIFIQHRSDYIEFQNRSKLAISEDIPMKNNVLRNLQSQIRHRNSLSQQNGMLKIAFQ